MNIPGYVDAIGRVHAIARSDARIVSLVPSLTELIFDLGAGDRLVGRTGFCVHPREQVKTVPKVGGTKAVDIEAVRILAPTHLVVNIDENEKGTVDKLAAFVPNVIVTHPKGPLDNPPLYRMFGGIFSCAERAAQLCESFQTAYFKATSACADLPRQRVLYVIWKSPWMTVSRDTYISRTLAAFGWDTIEVENTDRYPEVEFEGGLVAAVDRILLSSEPYAFREKHLEEIRSLIRTLADRGSSIEVSLIDGEMTSWYGSRAVDGLAYLAAYRADRPVSVEGDEE